jgi:hypothetical protein
MNQIFKPAARDRMRFDGDPRSGIAHDTRARPAGRVDYDDGDPATILPADHRPMARSGGRDHIRPVDGAERGTAFRAPLASVAGASTIEYDDGNPATIAPGAD